MKPVALLLLLALVSCADPNGPGPSPAADWLSVQTTFESNTVRIEKVAYRSTNGLRVNGQVCRTTILGRRPVLVVAHGGFDGLGGEWNGGLCKTIARGRGRGRRVVLPRRGRLGGQRRVLPGRGRRRAGHDAGRAGPGLRRPRAGQHGRRLARRLRHAARAAARRAGADGGRRVRAHGGGLADAVLAGEGGGERPELGRLPRASSTR